MPGTVTTVRYTLACMSNMFATNPFHRYAAAALFACILLLSACSPPAEPVSRPRRIGAGNITYGGVLRVSVNEDIRSVFPHNMVDAAALSIMNQVYEGLVSLDGKTGQIKPAIASEYAISPDGKTYRFTLREDVYFHDDKAFPEGKGRQVKSADVAYCFTKLCEPAPYNQLYAFVTDLIAGASGYYEALEKGQKNPPKPRGIRVVSDFVIEFELEHPSASFLTILTLPCSWIFPEELYSYGQEINSWSIGTGPFRARTLKMNDVIILERNKRYWKTDSLGNSLPYLDAVRFNFISDAATELSAFSRGSLDIVLRVPYGELSRLNANTESANANYHILTAPGLRTEYYGFQHRSPVYSNLWVRKAFNCAIDRDYLTNHVLKGYGTSAHHGFVPYDLPGYDNSGIEGYRFQPELAREYLAKAGFPGGAGFPVVTIQLNDGNVTSLEVADAIQEMLSTHLGLTVELAVLPRNRHYDMVERGYTPFWRDGWIADYPDPENFLKLFHGKLVPEDSIKASYLNTARFKDPTFDKYFEAGLRETNPGKRMEWMLLADAELVKQAAVLPLYHEKWTWLVSNQAENVYIGTMGELNLTRVYIRRVDRPAT